jgi:hypothetical protein
LVPLSLAICQSPCSLVKSVNTTKLATRYSPSNRMVITDIFKQRNPRRVGIPITRYRSRVWSSIASVQSRKHRVFYRSRSDSLQRRYHSSVRSSIRMIIRERRHCVGCRLWSQSSCVGQWWWMLSPRRLRGDQANPGINRSP